MATCPAGHESATTDFCDVCGAPIAQAEQSAQLPASGVSGSATSAGSAPATGAAAAGATAEPCPACGTPKTGRFCEACGYDFVSRPPVAAPAPTPDEPVTGWVAVVAADRLYFENVVTGGGPDADAMRFPEYCPERRFRLSGEQVRIGRHSVNRGITPEIDLSGPPADPGVSHLHAVLIAQPDGGWALVDPGSTNGTTLNDSTDTMPVNSAVQLSDGDRIHVGAWTTITVHADPPS